MTIARMDFVRGSLKIVYSQFPQLMALLSTNSLITETTLETKYGHSGPLEDPPIYLVGVSWEITN